MLQRIQIKRKYHLLLLEMRNDTVILEESLAISYKAIILGYDPEILLFGIYPTD